MSEPQLHNIDGPHMELQYCQLAVKYARLCWIADKRIFSRDKDFTTAPAKVFLVFGHIGTNRQIMNGFHLAFGRAFSMSSSIARFGGEQARLNEATERFQQVRRNIRSLDVALNENPNAVPSMRWATGNCAEYPAVGW